jgi:membrane fusion protein, multidrug efflux system
MSNQGGKTGRFRALVGGFLGGAAQCVGRARAWSARRLPGGEVTMWCALGVAVVLLLVLAGTSSKNRRSQATGSDIQAVAVAQAVKGDINITLSALGTVTPLATTTITPRVGGQVVRVDFHEGEMVKVGDVLAVIDPRSYKAALDEAKGTLAKDQATLANAAVAFKRQKALFAEKATSQQDLDSAVATYREAQGTVKADQASVESAAINFSYTSVISPIAGRVGLRGVDVGNYVSAGQTTGIAVVTQMDPMSVLFAIPEDSVGAVMARMNSGAGLIVDVYDRAQTRRLASGELSAVDSQISTTTGTVKMRAMFDNADGVLFPNQFVNVKVLVDTLHGQTIVPVTAIQRGSQGTYVFVVKADHTVTMRAVTLGVQDGDRIAIAKGLNPGETVVTDGADRLSDGAEVSVPSGKKIENVAAAAGAVPLDERAQRHMLMRKLTPDEREQLHAMGREESGKWLKAHRAELMKRKDQPRPPGGGRGPHGGGPPPM